MKKCFQFLAVLFSLTTIFSSCQKELSQEGGIASGTFVKDANGGCQAYVQNGAFKKDTVLTSNNYVDVQLNLTQVGNYALSTNTVNGYSFKAAGVSAITGLNSIRLIASGKPIAVGTNVFTVKFNGGDSCQFNITVTAGTGGGGGTTTAVFTFPNGTSCTGATQTNNFYAGLLTNPTTNTITLLVNVTTAGSYNLTTTASNGITFTSIGNLNVGTSQPITLVASGTPTAAGTINYTFSTSSPASSCGFDLVVQPAPAAATYTINCGTAATQTGTFQAGTALATSAKITLSVTPATIGTYTISTNTVNGVKFVGSGNFTTTTAQPVDLFADPTNNTPNASGPFTYTTTGGTAACTNVGVTYTTAPVGGTRFIRAKIGSATAALTTFNINTTASNTSTGGVTQISFSGLNNANSLESFRFNIGATSINTGTDYTVNQILASGVLLQVAYDDTTGATFTAVSGLSPQVILPFKVNFSVKTANRIAGTFSGRTDDGGTGFKDFYAGEFDITF